MAYTEEQIKTDIKAQMQKGGGKNSDWYVGIAAAPKDRLFKGHGVKEDGDWWIYRQAESERAARSVESYFISTLKTDGGGGGGTNPTYVYAYKKNAHTDP